MNIDNGFLFHSFTIAWLFKGVDPVLTGDLYYYFHITMRYCSFASILTYANEHNVTNMTDLNRGSYYEDGEKNDTYVTCDGMEIEIESWKYHIFCTIFTELLLKQRWKNVFVTN